MENTEDNTLTTFPFFCIFLTFVAVFLLNLSSFFSKSEKGFYVCAMHVCTNTGLPILSPI